MDLVGLHLLDQLLTPHCHRLNRSTSSFEVALRSTCSAEYYRVVPQGIPLYQQPYIDSLFTCFGGKFYVIMLLYNLSLPGRGVMVRRVLE
jgi:hypothetical protein